MLTVIKDNIDYTLTVIKNYLLSVRALYFLHTSILTVHNSLLVSSHGIDSEPYLMGAWRGICIVVSIQIVEHYC